MGMGALGMMALGALSGRKKAKDQERFAKESAKPRPYEEHVTTGAPAWMQPYLQDTLSRAWGGATSAPRPTPLFSDMSRYQSAWSPQGGGGGQGFQAGGPPTLRDSEGGAHAMRGGGYFPRDSPRGEGAPGMAGAGFGGGGQGGGGRGGGGDRGSRMSTLQDILLQGAQGPGPEIQNAMRSLSPFLGGASFAPALAMQQQLAQQQMSPQNPLQALIDQGMGGFMPGGGGGLNAASPLYGQFSSMLMDRFQDPRLALNPYQHLNFYSPGT